MSPPAMPDGGSGSQPHPSNSGAPQSGPPGGWQPNGQSPPQAQPPQAYPQQPGPGYPETPPQQQPGYPYTDPGQYPGGPAPQQSGYPYMDPGQYPGHPVTGAPQQPGYPYGDPAQHGIPGQAPPKKNKVAWLIGITAIVLVLVGTGGTLFATGVFGSSDDDSTEDTDSAETGDQARYVSPDKPCQELELDLSGLEEHAPAEGELVRTDFEKKSPSSADTIWQCHVEFHNEETLVFGELSIVGYFHAKAEGAERDYESPLGTESDPELEEEQEGDWNQAKSVITEKETRENQELMVQDGNLLLWTTFELSAITDESMEFRAEDFSDPLQELSTQILDKTRA